MTVLSTLPATLSAFRVRQAAAAVVAANQAAAVADATFWAESNRHRRVMTDEQIIAQARQDLALDDDSVYLRRP